MKKPINIDPIERVKALANRAMGPERKARSEVEYAHEIVEMKRLTDRVAALAKVPEYQRAAVRQHVVTVFAWKKIVKDSIKHIEETT